MIKHPKKYGSKTKGSAPPLLQLIMRSIKPNMSLNTLKTVYHSYFNSITNYGLPFWGNSPHSIKIFRMQKNAIRIMLGCKKRV
jgi:hypothetical protein